MHARDALLAATAPLGGTPRAAQLEMADRIEAAIERGASVSIEAPTGTGKSFGYLVPAILSGRKAVVVTATKALQDQLDRKDLPYLAEHLDVDFTWALLKGRANYACRAQVDELRHQLAIGVDADRAGQILDWVDATSTGDQAELDVEGAVWSAMSMTSEECPGAQKCTYGKECFYEVARARAASADVVVTNTAMYGAHVASGGAVLPEHDVLIFDEAHGAEDALRNALCLSVDEMRLRQLANRAANVEEVATDDVERLRTAGLALDAALIGAGEGWLRRGPLADPALEGALADAVTVVTAMRAGLDRAIAKLGAATEANAEDRTRLERVRGVASATESDLTRVQAWVPADVCWIETARNRVTLRLAPLDVSRVLHTAAWADGVVGVLTSATLHPATGTRLGLETYDAVELPSPFDHRRQSLLYVPALPEPRMTAFRDAADAEIVRLLGASGGRALVLFTSYAAMKASAETVAAQVDVPILVQGEGSKAVLFDAFLADEATCLFATMSFWQGIDPAGSTCSLVIVDKIPFARPDDPVVSAQREAARADAFSTVDLPRAATLLAQGVGRLIRAEADRGVVAVLDCRLAEKSYRRALLDRLPPMKRTRDFTEVQAFFAAVDPALPA